MIDLTKIIDTIIALLAALVTAFVVPWIKANVSLKKRDMLHSVYRTLVYAAEQIFGSGKGDEKLAYVKSQLEAEGYTVDIDMIEATVRENFGKWDAPAMEATEEKAEEG